MAADVQIGREWRRGRVPKTLVESMGIPLEPRPKAERVVDLVDIPGRDARTDVVDDLLVATEITVRLPFGDLALARNAWTPARCECADPGSGA